MKHVITELTREGCRVERLAHNPAVVTFRAPDGTRLKLASDDYSFQLARLTDDVRIGPVERFGTLRDVVRAVTSN